MSRWLKRAQWFAHRKDEFTMIFLFVKRVNKGQSLSLVLLDSVPGAFQGCVLPHLVYASKPRCFLCAVGLQSSKVESKQDLESDRPEFSEGCAWVTLGRCQAWVRSKISLHGCYKDCALKCPVYITECSKICISNYHLTFINYWR